MDWLILAAVLGATVLTIGSGVWVGVSLAKAISIRGAQAAEAGAPDMQEKKTLQ